jgi:hypothetical protein
MPIDIHMAGSDANHELASLYAWLCEEPDIRRHAHVSFRGAETGPTEMGSAFDIIQLVIDSGFQALNLALAYTAWRSTRSSHPNVTIEYKGNRVSLKDSDPDTVATIVRALR